MPRRKRKPPAPVDINGPTYAGFVPERSPLPYVEPSPFTLNAPPPVDSRDVAAVLADIVAGRVSLAAVHSIPKPPLRLLVESCPVAYIQRGNSPVYCLPLDTVAALGKALAVGGFVIKGETLRIHGGPKA